MASPPHERLVALDALRGLTIAGMILVNNPGDWHAAFPALQHAAWHGWTPTDLIFPTFLFIVGVSIALALVSARPPTIPPWRVYRRVGRRVILLGGLGLLLNALDASLAGATLLALRLPGVLQRIAAVYGLASLVVLRTTPRQQAGITAGCLLLYWAMMTLLPVPGYGAGVLTPEGNLAAYVDNLLLHGHLLQDTWDPEGLLSTIPAVASTLYGVLAGQWLQTSRTPAAKITGLWIAGASGLLLGIVWDVVFPINKSLWTSSYVALTTGMALVALACCYWVVDIKGYRRVVTPLVVFGTNAIAVYVLSSVLGRMLVWGSVAQTNGTRVSLQAWIYGALYGAWARRWGPASASCLYALTYVLFWLGLMWLLYRKRIVLTI